MIGLAMRPDSIHCMREVVTLACDDQPQQQSADAAHREPEHEPAPSAFASSATHRRLALLLDHQYPLRIGPALFEPVEGALLGSKEVD